jgi:diguanylate cyclase (GGDEF)-like protein
MLWIVGIFLIVVMVFAAVVVREGSGVWIVTALAVGAILLITALAHDLLRRARKALPPVGGGGDLAQLIRSLVVESHTDFLTGLHNRRSYDQFISEITRASGGRVALALIDIDRFKSINDRYGHPVGDAVLKALSRRWHDAVRGSDLLVRMGGDEFCLVLTGVGLDEALVVAEKIRNISTASLIVGGLSAERTALELTVSVGVLAWSTTQGPGAAKALDQADQALYAAKAGGGNQVVGKNAV